MGIRSRGSLVRYRYPLAFVTSVLAMGGAAWMIKYYLDMKEIEIRRELSAQQNMVEVVVASSDLPVGSAINAKTMRIRKIPFGYLPDGVIYPGTFRAVDGKTISEPMKSGRPLVRHNIKDITRVERFSDLLGIGQRAITLEVSGTTSVEHMLEAGDHIDLAVKHKKTGALSLLLERATVLATGNVTTADPKVPGMYKKAEYDSLTLGIDSAQVARVLAAEKQGQLVFLLRNSQDDLRSRYVTSGSQGIEVISGKGGEGGVLMSVNELISLEDDRPLAKRSASGRLLQKVSLEDEEHDVESEKEVAISHEGH